MEKYQKKVDAVKSALIKAAEQANISGFMIADRNKIYQFIKRAKGQENLSARATYDLCHICGISFSKMLDGKIVSSAKKDKFDMENLVNEYRLASPEDKTKLQHSVRVLVSDISTGKRKSLSLLTLFRIADVLKCHPYNLVVAE